VVSWADRIAYVCHDFEDAVAAGIVFPHELPAIVQERCGTTRGQQLAAFINGMVNATMQTTRIAMNADIAEALGSFRQFNYERVYLRPESQAQAQSVITLLQALVEHYRAFPHLVQGAEAAHDTEHRMRVIVEYVGGMTDQYAFTQAQQLLNWSDNQLPRGITP
jgi:dGTPase